MKILISLFFCSLQLSAYSQDWDTLIKIEPLQFEENIQVRNFVIQETYKLTDEHFVLIGQPKVHDPLNEGLRIIHLKKQEDRFRVDYLSYGAWESYIYRPTFFQGKDKFVVICEMGAEYSWGIDAFLLEADSMKRLGHMNVAARYFQDEHQESVVPFLEIMEHKQALSFAFGSSAVVHDQAIWCSRLYYKPGQEDESLIQNTRISFHYDPDTGWEERLY